MNNYLTIGETTFNVAAMTHWDAEKFKATYRGKVSFDIDNAWVRITERQRALGLLKKEDSKTTAPEPVAKDVAARKNSGKSKRA
jgi:hypothetical protein